MVEETKEPIADVTEALNEEDMGKIELPHMKEDSESAFVALNKIIDELDDNPEDNQGILDNAYEIKSYYEENHTFLVDQFEWIKSFTKSDDSLPEFIPNESPEPVDDPEADKIAMEKSISDIKARQASRDSEDPSKQESVVLSSASQEIENYSMTDSEIPFNEPISEEPKEDKSEE